MLGVWSSGFRISGAIGMELKGFMGFVRLDGCICGMFSRDCTRFRTFG